MGTFNSKPQNPTKEETKPLETKYLTPKEKALKIIKENEYENYLDLSNLDLTDEDLPEIPLYVNYLNLSNNRLTKIPKLHNEISELDLNDNMIKDIENLPNKINDLRLNNNQIKKLPDLSQYLKLAYLQVNNNQISEIVSFPKYANTIYLNNNHIESLPKLPKNLYMIQLYNNKISKLGKIPKSIFILLNKNPIFEDKIRVDKFDSDLIESRFFEKSDLNEENEFKVLNLKKGTVLFRTTTGVDNGFKDMFVGYKKKDKYIISPDHESYFFLHPFNIGYGDTTLIYVLTSDVKLIMGIKPARNVSKVNINEEFGQNCKTKEYKSAIKNIFNLNCINDKFIEKHPDVLGWIAPDDLTNVIKHSEKFNVLSSKGVGEYISYYENSEGLITRPEVVIYPFKKRVLVDVETPINDFSVDKIYENMDSYNYKPVLVIEDNQDIKVYKKYIDTLLSKKGYKDSSGTYHMDRRENGTYYIKEFI